MKEDPIDLARVRQWCANGDAERLRRSARLTRGEVARSCSVSVSTLFKWEAGERRPTGLGAIRYLAVLEALAALAE